MHETETNLDSPRSKTYEIILLRASQSSGVLFASRQAATHEAHPAQTLESIQKPYWASPFLGASEEAAEPEGTQEESARRQCGTPRDRTRRLHTIHSHSSNRVSYMRFL